MMSQLLYRLQLFLGLKTAKIQSFTYYIPSPPERKTGYREKQFDKVFYEFINRGYKILHMKTVSHSGANASGMWLIFTVKAISPQAQPLDLEFDSFMEENLSAHASTGEIEGLYFIKDEHHSNEV
ncbi:MAG: hypothetical protein COV37_07685 [Bdellovibrio sp. CG11_big_fil_rev_8_21_14_0_20_39_38]|nr:MAG: hypothetical protein COW78_02715 [Bdellovibrio sp. CG22_combo_CG10-13_8_21_14_all_39_27]PIR35604.1 MAG: hypothetical protein COV37_07685 [Bdellovibrio sp. CG11_big_fil_rev_8_21_14_0_20_39_38]